MTDLPWDYTPEWARTCGFSYARMLDADPDDDTYICRLPATHTVQWVYADGAHAFGHSCKDHAEHMRTVATVQPGGRIMVTEGISWWGGPE